ncbi:alpha-galactosidase [Lentzea alba]|uniref:glycoside hydrolase family 36 protein n=1 Tax=Lentzea alba TaxID=2714351 RepID=UPI0039BFE773
MSSTDFVASVVWGHSALELVVDVTPDGPVSVRSLSENGLPPECPRGTQPLVEVLVAGEGRARASHRFADTAVGARLAYVGQTRRTEGKWRVLHIDLRDERTGLAVRSSFRSVDGVPACQVTTTVTNEATGSVVLQGVTSFAAGFGGIPVEDVDLLRADSEWLGEGRWSRQPLRENVFPDLGLELHGQDGRGRHAVISAGSWSTGTSLPTGGLIDLRGDVAWLWQIEHNGAWRWEVGERRDCAYLALLGPTDVDHQWQQRLLPGESFTTVPVSVAVSAAGLDGAVAALTAHRRELVRPHRDHDTRPIVFNDYMNTLMGDPTTEKLLPLVDAAADAGAEVFCIDAGWYDDDSGWWDSVGEWTPSKTRFPQGIEEVIAHIHRRGMVSGLWLEPEVVGVRSPVADRLPAAAFLQRAGVRLVEHGRYHLDLRHPLAVAHLDAVIDRLVGELGIGYLKLDYNIDAGPGTDVAADSVGAGLLAHNHAHLAWLDGVLDRHPDLTLENCASGAMRMDYALLSRMQLQSTSDQQDFLRYPPIAVSAPLSVLPEQCASWAYPQPGMAPEEFAFALCTGMLGRLYLSGRVDHMAESQQASLRAAVEAYEEIRFDLCNAVPVWPLGLPRWSDHWLSLGLRCDAVTYLAVWQRGGDQLNVTFPLPHLCGADVDVEVLYPVHLPAWTARWDRGNGALTLKPTRADASARIFRISRKLPIPAPTEGTAR